MRTTINIDDPILKEVKALGQKEGKPLGRVVSDLLADGLRAHADGAGETKPSRWLARAMTLRVDLADKDAVWAAMEQDAEAPVAGDRP